MEEDELVSYKDISELKKELEGMKGKKDVSTKELYDAVGKLAQTIEDMLGIFGAAAEQMRLEDKGFEAETKKHEAIIYKLDKILDQNKTIAEGMVAIVEMVKQKIVEPAKEREELMFKPAKEQEEALFKPQPEPTLFKPVQQEWQPRPEPIMPRQQRTIQPTMPPPMQPSMAMPPPQPMSSDFGMEMPPMEPAPSPDLDFPSLDLPGEPFGLEEEPKKKGLFGMFKK
mgnify:CR=1 FL=1